MPSGLPGKLADVAMRISYPGGGPPFQAEGSPVFPVTAPLLPALSSDEDVLGRPSSRHLRSPSHHIQVAVSIGECFP